jgi:diadenosine tetraphosphate (Ap4A) HIT family hydrolase
VSRRAGPGTGEGPAELEFAAGTSLASSAGMRRRRASVARYYGLLTLLLCWTAMLCATPALAEGQHSQRWLEVRARGAIFHNIAVNRDYRGEHVLLRNQHVTAFLDISDPQHPRHDGRRDLEPELAQLPPARRAHILVIPNHPREHIALHLGDQVTQADARAVVRVFEEAEGVARQLALRNPQIFVNKANRVGVGYLHVHVVGERDPAVPYPPPLASP